MEKIYIIIEANGYDGYHLPHNDVFYLNQEEAEKEALRLDRAQGNTKHRYFDVHELDIAQDAPITSAIYLSMLKS